jgi:uncharacterized protein YcaQ
VKVTLAEARRLAIAAQRLGGIRPRPTRAGVLQVIRDIGYLQLDPTNVVARNPYLVLWSRLHRYDPTLLDDLLTRHRELFETPSLILPISDLPLHAATMRQHRRVAAGRGGGPSGRGKWAEVTARWLAKNQALRRSVLTRLKRDGPLPLTAFEDRAIVSWTSDGWNDGRNVSMMLSLLQRGGEIVVAGRRRGQKLWALADGWLPRVTPLPPATRAREATLRALNALGLATLRHLRSYYAFNRHVTAATLDALERDGAIVRVEVEDLPGIWYASRDLDRRLRALRAEWASRTTLLSPFDNLIMDRARTEELFGYRYRMEIYVPARLRKLGYWAMPILHDERIIGSVDPRYERATGDLIVNRVVLQPSPPRGAIGATRAAVAELAEFVGAKRVRWP